MQVGAVLPQASYAGGVYDDDAIIPNKISALMSKPDERLRSSDVRSHPNIRHPGWRALRVMPSRPIGVQQRTSADVGCAKLIPPPQTRSSSSFDNTTTKVGWTAGGGLEAKLAGWFPGWMGSWTGWSGKVEYLYMDLGHVNDNLNETYASNVCCTFAGFTGAVRTVSGNMRENIIRIGLNYQFH